MFLKIKYKEVPKSKLFQNSATEGGQLPQYAFLFLCVLRATSSELSALGAVIECDCVWL